MGYKTDFDGRFSVTPPLTPFHREYLSKFNETRRMKRDEEEAARLPDLVRESVGLGIGDEGGYFVGGKGLCGQDHDESIVDYNRPPKGQPDLWCKWRPDSDGTHIEWDENESFYYYVEWIKYLIEEFLSPWGYVLNGTVSWSGENQGDYGSIIITENNIQVLYQYLTPKPHSHSPEEEAMATPEEPLGPLESTGPLSPQDEFNQKIRSLKVGDHLFVDGHLCCVGISDQFNPLKKGRDELYVYDAKTQERVAMLGCIAPERIRWPLEAEAAIALAEAKAEADHTGDKQEQHFLPLDSAMALTDPDEIRDQIEVREQLKQRMIGDLYPVIMDEEISRLEGKLSQPEGLTSSPPSNDSPNFIALEGPAIDRFLEKLPEDITILRMDALPILPLDLLDAIRASSTLGGIVTYKDVDHLSKGVLIKSRYSDESFRIEFSTLPPVSQEVKFFKAEEFEDWLSDQFEVLDRPILFLGSNPERLQMTFATISRRGTILAHLGYSALSEIARPDQVDTRKL